MGKILAICNIVEFKFCNLKYDPEKSVELREYYLEINPDYHINKKNALNFYGNLNDNQIKEYTRNYYNLVIEKLPGKLKEIIPLQNFSI
tara:strand:+ start:544 stop:810 length:267 start_codon:yes stop_codon:yes gene_type:complete